MKHKILVITAFVFFLLFNTMYYWEGLLGIWAIPAFLLMGVIYVVLAIAFFRYLLLAIKEKFSQRYRLFTITLLAAILVTTFFKPSGLIDFDKLAGNDILIAEREGAANCYTRLKLKEDFSFRERSVCFGVTVTKGHFRIAHDTIYFENASANRNPDDNYQFAVVRDSKFVNPKISSDLIKYKNASDTSGYPMWITKNELSKLKNKAGNHR